MLQNVFLLSVTDSDTSFCNQIIHLASYSNSFNSSFFYSKFGSVREIFEFDKGGGGGQTWSHCHLIHINTSYSYSQNLHRFIIRYSVANTLFNFQMMHCSLSFIQYCLLAARGDNQNCLRWSWPTDYWSSCSSSRKKEQSPLMRLLPSCVSFCQKVSMSHFPCCATP